MRKSKFTEYQIVKILKAVEGGRAVTDVCREHVGNPCLTYPSLNPTYFAPQVRKDRSTQPRPWARAWRSSERK